jgi:hypothetical protein
VSTVDIAVMIIRSVCCVVRGIIILTDKQRLRGSTSDTISHALYSSWSLPRYPGKSWQLDRERHGR